MKTKCYSVRVAKLIEVSPKAVKIVSYNGDEDIIPKALFFGEDWEVKKSSAYWIASWICEKKNIQFSRNKIAWFDENRIKLPQISIEKHIPAKKEIKEVLPNDELIR